ncbi:MAG: hypothetical protein QOE59_1330 [Actinomycetota bacterium]|nr:hypothetical protein [Actinomycetota bacterium]
MRTVPSSCSWGRSRYACDRNREGGPGEERSATARSAPTRCATSLASRPVAGRPPVRRPRPSAATGSLSSTLTTPPARRTSRTCAGSCSTPGSASAKRSPSTGRTSTSWPPRSPSSTRSFGSPVSAWSASPPSPKPARRGSAAAAGRARHRRPDAAGRRQPLGHAQVSMTQNYYFGRRIVNPAAADALDAWHEENENLG